MSAIAKVLPIQECSVNEKVWFDGPMATKSDVVDFK